MDLLRSWLYGREKPDIILTFKGDLNVRATGKTSRTEDGNDDQQKLENTQCNVNNLYKDEDSSRFHQFVLRFVPLQPGDCLGCKLVGTSVMIASGIIVLTSAVAGRTRNPSLTGQKLLAYYSLCGSLFIGLEAAAVCRFFDLGPFHLLARQGTIDQTR